MTGEPEVPPVCPPPPAPPPPPSGPPPPPGSPPPGPPPPPAPPMYGTSSSSTTPTQAEGKDPQQEIRSLCQNLVKRLAVGSDSVLVSSYRHTQPVLQDGPMCGLVALCMAGDLTSSAPTSLSPRLVLNEARQCGYTKRGEMFSAVHMSALVEALLCCQTHVIPSSDECIPDLLTHLCDGRPALIPYDADANHEPCKKQGKKAHWALLTGAVFLVKDPSHVLTNENLKRDDHLSFLMHHSIPNTAEPKTMEVPDASKEEENLNCDKLFHTHGVDNVKIRCNQSTKQEENISLPVETRTKVQSAANKDDCSDSAETNATSHVDQERMEKLTEKQDNSSCDSVDKSTLNKITNLSVEDSGIGNLIHSIDPQDVYVYARHGKSRHIALWNLRQLVDSNKQLEKLDPKIEAELHSYVIPKQGMSQTLSGKIVLLG